MARARTALELAYDDCRAITRREAKNFYYAFLTLPAAKRRAIYAVYSFCRHCDDSVDEQGTDEAKLTALSSIESSLDQAFHSHPESPAFLALADAADRYDIPQDYFQEIILGVKSDLVKHRFRDFDELRQYCYRVASVVGLICLQIFEYQGEEAKDYAVDLGLAMQLTNILRDVRADLEMGRVYLPQDEMARFGYSEEHLRDGIKNEAFMELSRFQSERARGYYKNALRLLPHLSHRSRACPAVLGAIYSRVLDRIESSGFDVLGERRISLSTREKVRIMAQTWLGSMLGRTASFG